MGKGLSRLMILSRERATCIAFLRVHAMQKIEDFCHLAWKRTSLSSYRCSTFHQQLRRSLLVPTLTCTFLPSPLHPASLTRTPRPVVSWTVVSSLCRYTFTRSSFFHRSVSSNSHLQPYKSVSYKNRQRDSSCSATFSEPCPLVNGGRSSSGNVYPSLSSKRPVASTTRVISLPRCFSLYCRFRRGGGTKDVRARAKDMGKGWGPATLSTVFLASVPFSPLHDWERVNSASKHDPKRRLHNPLSYNAVPSLVWLHGSFTNHPAPPGTIQMHPIWPVALSHSRAGTFAV